MAPHDVSAAAPLTTRRALLRGSPAIAVIALAAVGCSAGGVDSGKGKDGASGQGSGKGAKGSSSPQASDGASDGGGAVVDDDAKQAGVDPSGLGEPAATVETAATVEGDPKATMTVSVYPLQRNGRAVTATYSFVVRSSAPDPQPEDLYGYFGDTGWHPFAIDAKNMNRHGVISSKSGASQTNYQGAKFVPGQTFYAFATFAAPPADVKTMDVYMAENSPLASGVPIA